MAPPQHKVDATLQAMERAHRASPGEQVQVFSKTINTARRDFESFSSAEESASRQNQGAGGSLLALVENERELDHGLDRSLEKVKESLAEMERKRMLALGAMTRLSPEESLAELSKVKEHILNLSLRVPIRADFIVHGHNISLSIFRLFEAAERAEAEVDALINAKRSLDGEGDPPPPESASELLRERATDPLESFEGPQRDEAQFTTRPQVAFQQENYESTEVDLGPIQSESDSHSHTPIKSPPSPQEQQRLEERQPVYAPMESATSLVEEVAAPTPPQPKSPRTPTTTGLRLRQALKRSSQTSNRSITTPRTSKFSTESADPSSNAEDHQIFRGGDEEFDL